jgi:lipoprotein-releasing system permease protein
VARVPFTLFLALRYLKPVRVSVSLITAISVLGVVFGVWALVVVISVMTGFDRELQRKVLGFDAHIFITNDQLLRDWRALDEEVQKVPGIQATAPFAQGPVIVEFNGRVLTPKIRGIDVAREVKLIDLPGIMQAGTHDMQSDQCIIGTGLADQLDLILGDKITVYAPRNISQVLDLIERIRKDPKDTKSLDELKEVVLPVELAVTGIFESGRYTYDSEYVLTPLHMAQELYGLGDDIHGISARSVNPYALEPILHSLEGFLPPGTKAYSWIDLNKQLFDAIRVERNTMFIIVFFIVIVAGFGIMSTLITVTVQKTREIGVLKALGARPAQIVFVFLIQGIIIGTVGIALGLGLGLLTVNFRNEFKEWLAHVTGVEIFPPGIYQFSQIPAEIVPSDVMLICVCAFVISSLAALVPAAAAALQDPVKALRHE